MSSVGTPWINLKWNFQQITYCLHNYSAKEFFLQRKKNCRENKRNKLNNKIFHLFDPETDSVYSF